MNLTLSTPRLALRLWQSHLIMIVFGFIVFATNDFTKTHPVITGLATAFLLMIYFILCYNEANRCGKNDVNQGKDGGPLKGLFAGLLAALPGAVLYGAGFFFTMPQAWYRLYMVVFEGLLSFTGEGWLMKLAILLPLPLISGIAYGSGRKGRNLVETVQKGLTKLVYQEKNS